MSTNKTSIFLSLLLALVVSAGVSYLIVSKLVSEQTEISLFEKELVDRSIEKENNYRRNPSNMSGTYFSDAAEMAVNSVVYVKVVKRAKYQAPSSFYDLLFGFIATPKDEVGIGSGVIISQDGYIVTNNHVIAEADEVQVTLYDNTIYPAQVIGTDVATDLALLKVDANNLIPIEMDDSDNLRLGEWVLAIGSPYDLRSTITAGIVSAKGRAFPNYDGSFRVESFIQTDAAVNPGNSGGALVNVSGKLVGINTSIVSLTGSYAGYSFAVPVNIVKRITDDFIKYGKVLRATLGITMTDSAEGVKIVEVAIDGAAEKAGVRAGDILKEINLVKVPTTSDVQTQVNKLRPGEKAVLTILRDNYQKEIMVNL